MVLYLLLLILIIGGIIQSDYKKISEFKGLYVFIFFFASTLTGAFMPIGGDCKQYLYEFNFIPDLNQLSFSDLGIGVRHQPLWIYFNSICKGLYNNFNFYLFIHSIVINSVFFSYISKHTKYKFTALLIFLTTLNYFYFNIEIQREALAVAVALIIYKYLKKKQYLYYYIGCIIAFLFHVSAVALLLLPGIFYLFKYKDKKSFILLLALLIVGLCSLNSYISFFAGFEYLSGMVNQFDNYNGIERNSTNLIIAAAFSALPIIIFLYLSRKLDYKNDMLINFTYLYLIITICGPFVTGIYRLNNYFYFPYLAFISNVLITRKPNQHWQMLCIIAIICIYTTVVYTWSEPMIDFNYQLRHYELFIPYRSCFDVL